MVPAARRAGNSGTNQQLPTEIKSVSCWNPGDCVAVGDSGASTDSERPILAVQEGTVADLVLTDDSDPIEPNYQSFAATRLDGQWNNAVEIPGADQFADSQALAASCPATGSCVIGGFFACLDHGGTPYVANEETTAGTASFGTFGAAQPVAGDLNTGNNDDGNGAVEDIDVCSLANARSPASTPTATTTSRASSPTSRPPPPRP